MLVELEDAVVECAGHVEGAVTEDEAAFAVGHQRLALGDVVAVEVDDPFVCAVCGAVGHGGAP